MFWQKKQRSDTCLEWAERRKKKKKIKSTEGHRPQTVTLTP